VGEKQQIKTTGWLTHPLYLKFWGNPQVGRKNMAYDLDNILDGYKCGKVSPFSKAEAETWSDIPLWISTGCPSLNYAIGGYKRGFKGGIPIGKALEISGMESTAKSAMLDHIIRETLGVGGAFFLCDAEHAHEEERMILIGCDLTNFRFIEKPRELVELEEQALEDQEEEDGEKTKKSKKGKKRRGKTSTGNYDVVLEEFLEIAEDTVTRFRKKVPNPDVPIIVAIDSLAAIETEMQAETDKQNMRDKLDIPTVMSQRFKGLCQAVTRLHGSIIVVNQLRTSPNVMFGNPDYTPGGNAKNFHFSIRIQMEKAKKIKAEDDVIDLSPDVLPSDVVGIQGRGEIIKNKVAAPFRKFRFPLYFDGRGILHEQCIVQMIWDREKWNHSDDLEKSGNTLIWRGNKLGNGEKEQTRTLLDDPALAMDLEDSLFG
jgi:recombination protein RecA